MLRILAALLLSVSTTMAIAGDHTQVFAASTRGQLRIDGEGRVAELTLDHKQLGEEVMAAVEQRIRAWRFEPVLVDGRPVSVPARMRLDMLALREPGEDGLTLAIRHVAFFDSEVAAPATDAAAVRPTMPPPAYPAPLVRLNIGGTVWLVVRLGVDGRVVDVASQAVELRTPRADGPAKQQGQARELMRASERAARDWIIPAQAGRVVMIPVKYSVGAARGERWARIHNVPVEPPAWVVAEQGTMVRLSESGQAGSARLRLLSALN